MLYIMTSKKLIFFLSLLFLLFSCASIQYPEQEREKLSLTELQNKCLIESKSIFIHPGFVRLLEIPLKKREGIEIKGITCGREEIPFYLFNQKIKAYLAESYFSKRKKYACKLFLNIRGQKFIQKAFDVRVTPYPYKKERLHVDKKRVFLSKEDLERVKNERIILGRIYKSSFKRPYFRNNFIKPLNSYITSPYGVKRLFNNKKQSRHLGIDFRAKPGVPVPCTNGGRVVLAKDLFFSGNTVIIDHGLNIFSTYAHLSKIMTVEGEFVPQGAIIGLSGMSGRVSGPHLHWGVRIHGKQINGFSLIEEGI